MDGTGPPLLQDHLDTARQDLDDGHAGEELVVGGVLFDGEPFDQGTPFIMYVWAGSAAVGDVYPSPYVKSATTFVPQSGDPRSGEWVDEERDVVSDFEGYFGRKPQGVTGVALLVDTDNTGSEATSWFDALTLERR